MAVNIKNIHIFCTNNPFVEQAIRAKHRTQTEMRILSSTLCVVIYVCHCLPRLLLSICSPFHTRFVAFLHNMYECRNHWKNGTHALQLIQIHTFGENRIKDTKFRDEKIHRQKSPTKLCVYAHRLAYIGSTDLLISINEPLLLRENRE